MDISKQKSYWDTFTQPYQMGDQKHRLYLLDLLEKKGVETLLDAGCGTAPILKIILNSLIVNGERKYRYNTFKKYKGVDYSPAMIEIAKREFPDSNFEVQDARELKELDNSWDCVLLLHTLDHLDDYKSAIKEATRVSDKYVCIVLWRPFCGHDNLNSRNMMGKQEGEEPWEDTYLHEYRREDLEEEFKKNNLEIEHIAEGEALNSNASKYNFLYLLKKI